jgi:hypothetical protein
MGSPLPEKMIGLSRAQTTRLITLYPRNEEVKPKAYRRHRFAHRYTRQDMIGTIRPLPGA